MIPNEVHLGNVVVAQADFTCRKDGTPDMKNKVD